jgi:hypothetical protein
MTSILVLLPVNGSRVQYVLSCDDPKSQWIYLFRWLTEKSIAFCSQEEYQNPNGLKANQLYCVVKNGTVEDAYLLFQCLPTPDWESKEIKAPNFTSDMGNLAWVLMNEDKMTDETDKEKIFNENLIV